MLLRSKYALGRVHIPWPGLEANLVCKCLIAEILYFIIDCKQIVDLKGKIICGLNTGCI